MASILHIISKHPYLQEILAEHLLVGNDAYQLTSYSQLTNDSPHLFIIDTTTITIPAETITHIIQPIIFLGGSNADYYQHHYPLPLQLQSLLQLIHHLTEEAFRDRPLMLAQGFCLLQGSKILYKTLDGRDKIHILLTDKEVALIEYLYHAQGAAISKDELLKSLWNYDPEANTHTVETHIYRLRQKISDYYAGDEFIKTEQTGYRLLKD